MKINRIHFIAPKDCPYTYRGANLAELRHSKLKAIAKSLDVEPKESKNETLGELIVRCKALGKLPEITASE